MRLTAAEKYEVIRLVEGSDLSVRHTLRELQVPRATFYTWYRRYVEAGLDGLAPRPSAARRSWNRIPPRVRQRVVDAALRRPSAPRANWRGNSPTRWAISSRNRASIASSGRRT